MLLFQRHLLSFIFPAGLTLLASSLCALPQISLEVSLQDPRSHNKTPYPDSQEEESRTWRSSWGLSRGASASEATWETWKKNTGGGSRPPTHCSSALPNQSQSYLGLAKPLLSGELTAPRHSFINANSAPVEEVGGRQFPVLFFSAYQRAFALNSSQEWVNHFGYKIMIRPSSPLTLLKQLLSFLKSVQPSVHRVQKGT